MQQCVLIDANLQATEDVICQLENPQKAEHGLAFENYGGKKVTHLATTDWIPHGENREVQHHWFNTHEGTKKDGKTERVNVCELQTEKVMVDGKETITTNPFIRCDEWNIFKKDQVAINDPSATAQVEQLEQFALKEGLGDRAGDIHSRRIPTAEEYEKHVLTPENLK